MSCCNEEDILNDPCQALLDGTLNYRNFVSYGFTPWSYALLIAQCGVDGGGLPADIGDQLDDVIAGLAVLDVNTDDIESQLTTVISELGDSNANLTLILTELSSILTSVQAIDANTDGFEGQLTTVISTLTDIDTNTDDLESLITAGNALLTTIRNDAQDDDLFGTHTVASGTHAAAPAAGPYSSWVVVKTNDAGTVTVDGITLNDAGDSTAEEAQPQHKVPAPTITLDGGNLGEYEWRTKS